MSTEERSAAKPRSEQPTTNIEHPLEEHLRFCDSKLGVRCWLLVVPSRKIGLFCGSKDPWDSFFEDVHVAGEFLLFSHFEEPAGRFVDVLKRESKAPVMHGDEILRVEILSLIHI